MQSWSFGLRACHVSLLRALLIVHNEAGADRLAITDWVALLCARRYCFQGLLLLAAEHDSSLGLVLLPE